jgi:uncharacterized protein
MLLVKTYVDKSKIHGIGLFANEFIPKGTIIWQYNSIVDRIATESEIKQLRLILEPDVYKELRYPISRLEKNIYVIYGDNTKFTNHSENPNIVSGDGLFTIADRDINIGEELTENYLDIYYDEEDIGFLKERT